jgi:EpsI family protein
MLSNLRIATVVVLFALTFFALQYFSEVQSTPILQPLNAFPETIDDWKVVNRNVLSGSVTDMLGVDDYIDYTYENGQGQRISLYVSYFSALGISGEYHSPQNCLPGGGWNILAVDRVPIRYTNEEKAMVNRMTVKNWGHQQLVYYWFQNRGRIIASEYWDKIYTVLDSLSMRRRDGSFIRIMSMGADDQAVRAFSQQIANELDAFLPGR